ncbi:hypothetical protein ANN_13278 [Periplaneta americana]|uniref:Mos1 transposase HTH domain-containing protein n=1 Tax=Periplaneta americana TaxID=6978 RepID=A0ABQ8TKZ5_PERAM|nr:hypothetical protein ANN_13278 [Periplaneta americana]
MRRRTSKNSGKLLKEVLHLLESPVQEVSPIQSRNSDDAEGRTAAETVGMLWHAFNDNALGKSQIYEWFSRFKSGNMSTEDMLRPERPSTGRNDENIANIKRAIDEDRRKTIDEVSEQTNLS